VSYVWGLGFGVWGLGFGVWGLGFRVFDLRFGLECCVLFLVQVQLKELAAVCACFLRLIFGYYFRYPRLEELYIMVGNVLCVMCYS